MPKEQPRLSKHSLCATSSKNAKDKINSMTLLAMSSTEDAVDSRGRCSCCSSEKDSGYSGECSKCNQKNHSLHQVIFSRAMSHTLPFTSQLRQWEFWKLNAFLSSLCPDLPADSSDWQQTDVEERRSLSRGSEHTETSQPGQRQEVGREMPGNPTVMPAGREFSPIYIVNNMVLKQVRLVWAHKGKEFSVPKAEHTDT